MNDVTPTGSKRKHETNDDDNSELQESIPILKAQRTATKDIADVGMTEKAKKILSLVDLTNRRSANQALKEVRYLYQPKLTTKPNRKLRTAMRMSRTKRSRRGRDARRNRRS